MPKIKTKCEYCGKRIEKFKCYIKQHPHHFCNSTCAVLFNRPRLNTGKGEYLICIVCKKKFYARPSRVKSNAKFCSKKCYGLTVRGDRYEFWKRQSPKLKKLRHSSRYISWRKKVFIRDHYSCVLCKSFKRGGYIIAHHIKSFAFYPKERFKIYNGLTVCKRHHNKIHDIDKC